MIPLSGFAPDADATKAGVIVDCDHMIPYEAGMRGAPTPVDVGSDALAAACRGAAVVSDLAGDRRVYAGTAAALFELVSGAWTDRSSGAYTLGVDDRWSFVQFGDTTVASTPTVGLQRSTGAAFATISGAPTAKLVEAAQGFVLAFNTTTSSDEWYCCAYLDETDWTLSVSTQCVKGRLIGGSGPIVAARRFGDDIIAYKAGAMFVGRYQGAPAVWGWQQVSNDVGCIGQDAVVDTSIGHVFVGRDNVYVYDGTTPRPLATGTIRTWLFNDMSPLSSFKSTLLWDRRNNLVWLFYPSSVGGGAVDRCVVYHVLTQQWGVSNLTIEAAITYISGAVTYDDAVSIGTYDTYKPGLAYDSAYWVQGAQQPAIIGTDHKIAQLSGVTADAYFVTGDLGDDQGYLHCDNLRVRYLQAPLSSSVVGYTKDTAGGDQVASTAVGQSDGQHHVRQTGRWHRFKVSTTGDFKVTAIRPNFKPAGMR